MRVCEFEGCGRKRHARGLCYAHYDQMRAGKPLRPARRVRRGRTDVERFWDFVVRPSDPNACWGWNGATVEGYGVMNRRGERLAHRFSWEIHNGRPPRADFHVMHSCDNPPCCNPAHLAEAPPEENWEDMRRKGRHARGEKVYQAKLTESDVIDIRTLRGLATLDDLAVAFGIHKEYICEITGNRRWRHV